MAIYARDNFDCVYCVGVFPRRLDGRGLQLDHVKPRKAGGKSTARNLVTACARCNSRKQARPLDDETHERVKKQLRKPVDRRLGRQLAKLHGYRL
jgi:5-methylcytosine-specific restriction endonuclease McrA